MLKEHKIWTYLSAGAAASLVASVLVSVSMYAIGAKAYACLEPQRYAVAQATNGRSTGEPAVSPYAPGSPVASEVIPGTAGERAVVSYKRNAPASRRFVLFAFPLVWLVLIAASALFSGFLGIFEKDVDREWWARAGGLMMSVLGGWLVMEAMVIAAPGLMDRVHSYSAAAASTGLLAGLAGALGGASTAGGIGAAAGNKANLSKLGGFLNQFGLVVPTLCGVALFILGLLMAVLEVRIAQGWRGIESTRTHLEIAAAAAVVAVLINWAININIFSLHGMYRMRLMRAFLGASNTERWPNAFTGFDDSDNLYEKDLPVGPGVPLHIVNATVNLVGTKKLAWRQRKAEGFTFSPLHCGGWRIGYVKTENYGRVEGLSLGTAMAISGAAFNPNMGYHSSPLVTLIMTLFNVRLGWWLPNPKYRRPAWRQRICERLHLSMKTFLAKKAPRFALGPLIREALGGTDDTSAYVELTDGGHFENLGIYEMVLRRVQLIVVVDAGADPKCQLEDLGNAMRKVELDLGIPITFPNGLEMHAGPDKHNLYCALGEIHYECVDRCSSVTTGKLLYLKAGINGEEPPDVTQYARTHPTFPHESTANQFFNEAQFESYRHLGHHAVTQILKGWNLIDESIHRDEVPNGQRNIEALFDVARTYLEVGGKTDRN